MTNRSVAGLDEAILGSMNSCGDPEQDSKKIADLLKYGAHSLVRILLPIRKGKERKEKTTSVVAIR